MLWGRECYLIKVGLLYSPVSLPTLPNPDGVLGQVHVLVIGEEKVGIHKYVVGIVLKIFIIYHSPSSTSEQRVGEGSGV